MAEKNLSETGERPSEHPPVSQRRHHTRLRIIGKVCSSLIVAAAVVVLIVNFAFPVMRIYGSSMSSTLVDGDIVIGWRTTELNQGDICAFYYGNRILCKRVIGLGGDVIEMDDKGTITVNGETLNEPYLKAKSIGDCDIEFPYTVPADCYFVLGDNRRSSLDSRNTAVGCISEEQIVGKLVYRILPPPAFGQIGE